ncbi:glycosyltransferase family 4 protein [Candidatus Woesearchaeota archaeon]|jgi:glycosyltransferase involved in cell wall biosynthesis|nr:glycosyltransferase family 4 protein [Candidatus Woesearchaeota archaeon]MBT7169995.1 glycosyltransferase family 4 protein [Candidatus Woesearchaeota archaeon]MBT7786488.1 glycosyltransferase family 4 protein [Candidatus Woesearchaeota archaeon]
MVQNKKKSLKGVYLYSHFKEFHSLYKNLIKFPPEGYEYNIPQPMEKLSQKPAILKFLNYSAKKIVNPTKIREFKSKKLEIPKGTNLIYSAGNLMLKKFNWVVDCEHVTSFSGWDLNHFKKDKRHIEKILSSNHCKKIIPWTNAGKKTILDNLNCENFENKIETVNLAVDKKDFIKQFQDEKIKILFITSANLPQDFYMKGGKDVFQIFEKISENYPQVELIVRSWVPKEIKEKYGNNKNIKIIDTIIPWGKLEKIFQTSDIFLFPAHMTVGLAMLDAMSYELPIITTDVWANEEMVNNNINGIIIDAPKKIPYYVENFIPNWRSKEYVAALRLERPEFIQKNYDALVRLIENKNLRRKMGKKSRKMIETGPFSIKQRNIKLKRIFDNSIQ